MASKNIDWSERRLVEAGMGVQNGALAVALSCDKPPRALRDLRGVGKSIEQNLHQLGIETVEELAAADGRALYDRLNELTGVRQDPCVLDTFRCAVAQARNPLLPVEQTNWWWWSQQRKLSRV